MVGVVNDVPMQSTPELHTVLRRYQRLERYCRVGLGVIVGGLVLAGFTLTSSMLGLLIALGVIVSLYLPLFQPQSETRLRSRHAPEEVADQWHGPRPPILAVQWGLADDIIHNNGRWVVYTFSRFGGLRSAHMTVEHATLDESSVTVTVSVDGHPWGMYHVEWAVARDETIVSVTSRPVRAFGLKFIPQWIAANQVYEAILAAQGYAVMERTQTVRA